ncbi:MAG TPA: PAS domain S-box protein, partial [Chloroflexota bacterium]
MTITEKQYLDERLGLGFQANPAALLISALADGRFLSVNRSYEALLGWSKEDLIGHIPLEFGVYPNAEARDEIVRQLRKTGSVRDFETQMRTKSGEVLDILASMELIELAGEPCILSVVIDLTTHRRVQSALRQREHELAFLAEASSVLASSLDYEQTLRSVAELAVPHIADWCA